MLIFDFKVRNYCPSDKFTQLSDMSTGKICSQNWWSELNSKILISFENLL